MRHDAASMQALSLIDNALHPSVSRCSCCLHFVLAYLMCVSTVAQSIIVYCHVVMQSPAMLVIFVMLRDCRFS